MKIRVGVIQEMCKTGRSMFQSATSLANRYVLSFLCTVQRSIESLVPVLDQALGRKSFINNTKRRNLTSIVIYFAWKHYFKHDVVQFWNFKIERLNSPFSSFLSHSSIYAWIDYKNVRRAFFKSHVLTLCCVVWSYWGHKSSGLHVRSLRALCNSMLNGFGSLVKYRTIRNWIIS